MALIPLYPFFPPYTEATMDAALMMTGTKSGMASCSLPQEISKQG
jgi:hypothetical protein